MENYFQKRYHFSRRKTLSGLFILTLAVVATTVLQDFLRTQFQHSDFYFSESLMFSSFWRLFPPLLYLQFVTTKNRENRNGFHSLLLVFSLLTLHVLAFPALVWLLSSLFYYHTFAYQQTLNYTLSEHLYQVGLIYLLPLFLSKKFFQNELQSSALAPEKKIMESWIMVSEGNRQVKIALHEVLYFSANTPYVNVHTLEKKYLLKTSLKLLSSRLDENIFCRVHKSVIVNLSHLTSYTSRQNGDYDLEMANDTQLRLSRNYAADFKVKFQRTQVNAH